MAGYRLPTPATRLVLLALSLLYLTARPTAGQNVEAADEPALARLSFWLPPERLGEFAAAYEERLAPVLERHGLTESPLPARATVDSVFSRLFALADASDGHRKRKLLRSDALWQKALREVGAGLGIAGPDSLPQYTFKLYDVPAGRGKAVRVGPGFRHGAWQSFGARDGLPSTPISNPILQDRRGDLWFPTWEGAVRYDGAEFVTFTADDGLAGSEVHSVFEDRDGNLWFATFFDGVSRYDGHRFTTFAAEDGLAGNQGRSIWQDAQGVLWVATTGGVSRHDGQRFHPLEALNAALGSDLESVLADGAGDLWVSTRESGVCRYDGEGAAVFTVEDGLAHNRVWSMLAARDGSLWFCTADGVSRYDGERFTTFTTEDGLTGDHVRQILEDRHGDLWFGTEVGPEGGITHYDGKRFAPAGATHTSGAMSIEDILEDRQGNLWFMAYPSGVVRYDGSEFVRFTTEDGLANGQVYTALEDDEGYLWFGTLSGVSRYDGSHFSSFTTRDGLVSNGVMSLLEDTQGRMWFGTWDGVCWYDGREILPLPAWEGKNVWSIVEDRRGNLWFGAAFGGGASRYDGDQITVLTPGDGLIDYISTICEDRHGNMWFGGYAGGVSRYDGSEFVRFATEFGHRKHQVYDIREDREGSLWFGTMLGVLRYDGSQLTPHNMGAEWIGKGIHCIHEDREGALWYATDGAGVTRQGRTGVVTLTTDDGLADNRVQCVWQDDRGTMWFGTSSGVSRYDGVAFQQLSREDGLVHDMVQDILQDRNGDIWIATEGGVTRYRPSRVPPRVQMVDVVADRSYGATSAVALPSSQRVVSFQYGGRSPTTGPDRMVYVYRLAGYDDEWRFTRSERTAYADLPEGEYVFEVRAVDRDLTYSEEPARVEVEVYYQPMSSSVRLSDLRVQDVFASFHKTYAERSIGSVVASNDDLDTVEVAVSFYIPDLMRRPTERKVYLAPRSSQRMVLRAVLDESILELEGSTPGEAVVSLSCEVGDQTISMTEKQNITIHGRGSLTWDPLGRAAAIVTPEDHSVAGFARALYETYRSRLRRRKVDGAIPTAMVLFEALDTHGIRYAADSSSPYAQTRDNRSAVDHIQYPMELLQSKMGDCDDCTVLYCSLLENLNVPTALMEAPGHVFMMFDSGVTADRDLGFGLGDQWYVERDGHFWIPVEVTKLGEGSFMDAWELGAKTCARLAEAGPLQITDVRTAWLEYPYALPPGSEVVEPPESDQLERSFLADLKALQRLRDDHLQREYIRPLLSDPDDHELRLRLARARIEAEDYNDGISGLTQLLRTDLRAEASFWIGYAYVGLDDYGAAIQHMEKALEADPDNWIYRSRVSISRSCPYLPGTDCTSPMSSLSQWERSTRQSSKRGRWELPLPRARLGLPTDVSRPAWAWDMSGSMGRTWTSAMARSSWSEGTSVCRTASPSSPRAGSSSVRAWDSTSSPWALSSGSLASAWQWTWGRSS